MSEFKKAHCLFEQSGTFKNEFIKLGIPAEDYDLQNEFGQTDHITDIFEHIDNAYRGGQSLFDEIHQDEIIMAFFPCTYFECKSQMFFYGSNFNIIKKPIEEKCEIAMERHRKLNLFYETLCKLVIVCIERGLKLVIENPYNQPHYLTTYWCVRPKIIDKDRTENGDYYKKPTQYWFIGFEPRNNLVFEPLEYVEKRTIAGKNVEGCGKTTARSMIHPQYASRFIKQYILENYNSFENYKGE